jgi:hypothetical protein
LKKYMYFSVYWSVNHIVLTLVYILGKREYNKVHYNHIVLLSVY